MSFAGLTIRRHADIHLLARKNTVAFRAAASIIAYRFDQCMLGSKEIMTQPHPGEVRAVAGDRRPGKTLVAGRQPVHVGCRRPRDGARRGAAPDGCVRCMQEACWDWWLRRGPASLPRLLALRRLEQGAYSSSTPDTPPAEQGKVARALGASSLLTLAPAWPEDPRRTGPSRRCPA